MTHIIVFILGAVVGGLVMSLASISGRISAAEQGYQVGLDAGLQVQHAGDLPPVEVREVQP